MVKLEGDDESDFLRRIEERKKKKKESRHTEIIAPSESKKPKKKPKSPSPEPEEVDEYIDDFDSFEEEDEPPPPPPPPKDNKRVLRPSSAKKRVDPALIAKPEVKVDVDEIKKAMQQENTTAIKNEPVYEHHPRAKGKRQDLVDFYDSGPSKITIEQPKAEAKTMDYTSTQRQTKRNNDLLDVIVREKENFDTIFEMFPMTAYD
jgi:hypothetical protein